MTSDGKNIKIGGKSAETVKRTLSNVNILNFSSLRSVEMTVIMKHESE